MLTPLRKGSAKVNARPRQLHTRMGQAPEGLWVGVNCPCPALLDSVGQRLLVPSAEMSWADGS